MKICYIISTVNSAGGANRSLLDFLPYVKAAGHDCTILACAHGSMEDAAKEMNIVYKVIPFSTYVEATTIIRKIKRRAANIYGKIAIALFLKWKHFDLLHNNSLPTAVGMDAARMIKLPYVCHVRENVWSGLGMSFYCPDRVKKIIQNADKVIAISDFIARSYEKYVPETEFLILNDGIKIENYYSEREIFKTKTVRIGIVGVINPQKGQKEAIRAVEILHEKGYSNIELDIIGNDGLWNGSKSYATDLKKYVAEKNLNYIHFIPAIESVEELRRKRDNYDINVICSNAEGLGRTTIESMLSGSLTIAANAGATPEIINNQINGLLYQSGNVHELVDCIEWALSHRNQAEKIAKEGQKAAVHRFSISHYSEKICELYKDILENDHYD